MYTRYKNPWVDTDLIPRAAALDQIESGIQAFAAVADSANTTLTALASWVRYGNGSPEGSVTAPVGTVFLRLNGTGGNIMYVKESGSGNTGWGVQ